MSLRNACRRTLAAWTALAAGLALTATAQAAAPAVPAAGATVVPAGGGPATPGAAAGRVFRPRIGAALGIFPALTIRGGRRARSASQPLTPLTYHGGQTMTGRVTVHTIFWTGGTNPFQGRPSGAPHDYTGMVEQYLTDVADASTGTSGQACTAAHCNIFTVEPQFGWGTTPGGITHGTYTIRYGQGDSMIDAQPYPPKSRQCASPFDTAVCVTDAQVQAEVSRVINATHGSRGLHDIWYVFTPPGVDECIIPGACESNLFGGYHSVSILGHSPAIYAYTGDPLVQTRRASEPGADPEGYPDAEHVIEIVAHEVNEAMSDPQGLGYLDRRCATHDHARAVHGRGGRLYRRRRDRVQVTERPVQFRDRCGDHSAQDGGQTRSGSHLEFPRRPCVYPPGRSPPQPHRRARDADRSGGRA